MRALVVIFLFLSLYLRAQDKVFLKSGKILHGDFVSMGKAQLFFFCKDSVKVSIIDKKQVLLVERLNGERYLIGDGAKPSVSETPEQTSFRSIKNAIGMQPLGLLVGRITFVYERFFYDDNIGVSIPISLTFDPFRMYAAADTSANAPEPVTGTSFISGIDLNYYFKETSGIRFFMGPRTRYGTDMMLGGIEGFSVQYQLGWHLYTQKRRSQHVSLGYGFVKILNAPKGSTINPDQLYGWFSINYRISLVW